VSSKPDPTTVPFGTVFCDFMTTARSTDGAFEYSGEVEPYGNFSMSPAAHVLHYGSAIFEGMKAHRQVDGSLAIFRLDDHVARMRQSAAKLRLPVPDAELVRRMIIDACEANVSEVPDPPGSLYVRPTLIGTEPNIGAAATPSKEALLYIVNCPVGDYFKGGVRPLTLLVEDSIPRTTPQFGMVKSGANYAMALAPTLDAMAANEAIDQILFATGGDVTETGAANFFMTDDDRLVTRNLDASFLHGVTRSSIITLAADLGYEVEERAISVEELVVWADHGEAFLSGTAAVVSPVGTLLIDGERVQLAGGAGPDSNSMRLRQALADIQTGHAPDPYGWRTPVKG
jgi:branched-chain amino acid aminotransferase